VLESNVTIEKRAWPVAAGGRHIELAPDTTAPEMRAVRFHDYGPPSSLVVDLVPRPEPKAGEVLLRVHAAGVNPIDWKFRAGYLRQFMPLELPYTPGLDVAGTVVALGPGVTEFAEGNDVFGRGAGAYAEYAIASVATLAHKPAGVSFEQAATLPVGGVTAWVGLFDVAHLEAGQRVLVQGGGGGVGSIAVQLAHWKGAYVIATASEANADHVRTLGADEVIDYGAVKFEDVVHDVDVVLETVGGDITERSWGVLKPGGIMVVVAGMPDAEKAASLGVRTSNVPPPAVTTPILEELGRLAASGALIPQVGSVFSLADAADAHATSETGHGRGRIVLQVAS
jgi:NADPH:quinone reductase-like Zn-dependent oxidoreductase